MKMKRFVLPVILALLLSACASAESSSRRYRWYGPDWECEKIELAGHGYGGTDLPCGR